MSWGDARQLTAVAASRWTTNPKHMPLLSVAAAGLFVKENIGARTASDVAGFHTALAKEGATASITVADTYVTVASLSGSGFLFNAVSPTHTAGFIPTMRITVDGTVYTIAPSANQTAAWRMVLGPLTIGSSVVGIATASVAGDIIVPNGAFDAGIRNARIGGLRQYGASAADVLSIPSESAILSLGMAALRFETSLVVEMKASLLSANAVDKSCSITYRMDV